MDELNVTINPLMEDDEFLSDNVQVRCYNQVGDVEQMKCAMHDGEIDHQIREFDGLFRTASAVGDGMLMTKGDDMVIISASQLSRDAIGKCADITYPDGEKQLLCKFWKNDELAGGNE